MGVKEKLRLVIEDNTSLKGKVFDYFIKNRMMMLMEELDGFKEPKYKSYAQDVMNLA